MTVSNLENFVLLGKTPAEEKSLKIILRIEEYLSFLTTPLPLTTKVRM